MRWQYRITFVEGNTGTCISEERLFDCLLHYRNKFGADRVAIVEERYGCGDWVASERLPTNEEEAFAISEPEEFQHGAA